MPFHDFITDPSGFRLGGAWWWNHLGTTTSCHGQYRTLAGRNMMTTLESGVFVSWIFPPFFWYFWVGWRLFFFLLTIPTKMDPFKIMMSFALCFLIKNTFIFAHAKSDEFLEVHHQKIPSCFFPNQPGDFVSRWRDLSKPTIGDLHLAIKMKPTFGIFLGDNRNCSSEKGWFAIVVKRLSPLD